MSLFANPITPFEVLQQDNEAIKIAKCYGEVAGVGGSVIYLNNEPVDDRMGDFLLSVATSSVEQYQANYLTGATIQRSESPNRNVMITGWFNSAAYHTIAISLSQVTNTLMRCFGQKEFSILTINHPLPWLHKSQVTENRRIAVEKETNIQFMLPERMSGSKHVQLVSGARLFSFWFSTFLGDFVAFLIPTTVMIIILEALQLSPYTWGSAIWFVLLDFILYGFSIIPFVYVLTFIFQSPSSGGAAIANIIFISSIFSTLVTKFTGWYNANAANVLEFVFYFTLPNFCFEKVFRDFIALSERHRMCSKFDIQLRQLSSLCLSEERSITLEQCCTGNFNYAAWEHPGIGRSLFCMAIQSVVLFLILFLIETSALSVMCPRRSKAHLKTEVKNEEMELGNELKVSQDSDVLCERDRVLNSPIITVLNTDLVVMQDLTKVFDDYTAVDRLSLGIHSGECFGLLGVNGAGKTTCFKILTGELEPSLGNAYVDGQSVWGRGSKIYPYIGYCPQSDALLDHLTVRETLWIFALLRGIPSEKRNYAVDAMIDRLTLRDCSSKLTVTLSGGNKRKLSVAVALIGDLPIIFLDEPTTGMDPVTRRNVWNTLNEVRKRGRTLILTSHCMEECEALCTRIAIMVNGRFQCLGSIQHLKSKFTEGYTLIIKTGGGEADTTEENQKNVNQIKSFVSSTFPESILKDHHEGLLNYQIQIPNLSWSQIFGIIERAKHHLKIEDYSVSQTTLEQVFISFARMQQHVNSSWSVKNVARGWFVDIVMLSNYLML